MLVVIEKSVLINSDKSIDTILKTRLIKIENINRVNKISCAICIALFTL